jgi:hypothetical protein
MKKLWNDPEQVKREKEKRFDRSQSERYAFKTGTLGKSKPGKSTKKRG